MKVLNLLFILISYQFLSAAPDSVIARVGNKVITTGELRTRFELSPQVFGKTDVNKKKELFLYTLIAEKLFALESEQNNADTSELLKYTYNEIERMYLRDALFKLEITDRVNISEAELKTAASREMYRLTLNPYFTEDSLEARILYKRLLNGIQNDTTEMYKAEEMEIGFGELRSDLENAVYNLKKGAVTVPLKYGTGWYLFQLKDKKLSENGNDVTTVIKRAEKKLKDIKSSFIYEEYFNHFFAGRYVEADGDVFWSLVKKIYDRLKVQIPGKDGYKLALDDIRYIEGQFKDSLWTPYIKIENNHITIKSFLRKLHFNGFSVTQLSEDHIAGKLNAVVKNIIENELLTAEAYKKGLYNLPDVQESLRMWKDNNLSTVFTMHIADSLINVPNKDSFRTDLLSIVEVTTENLRDIENILNSLNKGETFEELVVEFNRKNGYQDTKGFYNLIPAPSLGEIGKIASNLKEGDVYGPVSSDSGYSIVKLIKKQKSVGGTGNDKEKSAAYSEYARNLDAVKNSAVRLANKYNISINRELLDKLTVSDHNMFTIRMMGFGGRIPAVPVTSPFYEWYELWQKSLKEVP